MTKSIMFYSALLNLIFNTYSCHVSMFTNQKNYNETVILYNRVECEEQNNAIEKLKQDSNALIYVINKPATKTSPYFEVLIPEGRQNNYEYTHKKNSFLLNKNMVEKILKDEIIETTQEQKYLRIVYIPQALKENLCKALQDLGYLTFFKC